MIHDVAYKAAKQVAVHLGLHDLVVLCLRCVAGLLAGWLLFVLVERPTLAWARRFKVAVSRRSRARAVEREAVG